MSAGSGSPKPAWRIRYLAPVLLDVGVDDVEVSGGHDVEEPDADPESGRQGSVQRKGLEGPEHLS